jgi:hypothetical protein
VTRNPNSSYGHALPPAFPWVMTAPHGTIMMTVTMLLSGSRPFWSSFAVTMENWDETANLWLSQASYDYLIEQLTPNRLILDFIAPTQQREWE